MTELLDATRAGGDLDVIRKGAELVLQPLIDVEATEVIGAERYERADTRTTWRIGRSGALGGHQGRRNVEVKIPKLRKGSSFPSILEAAWRPTRRYVAPHPCRSRVAHQTTTPRLVHLAGACHRHRREARAE